jgi:hypothetical protein
MTSVLYETLCTRCEETFESSSIVAVTGFTQDHLRCAGGGKKP